MTFLWSRPGPRELGFSASGARGLVTPLPAARLTESPLGRASASGLTSRIFAEMEVFLLPFFFALVGVLAPAEAYTDTVADLTLFRGYLAHRGAGTKRWAREGFRLSRGLHGGFAPPRWGSGLSGSRLTEEMLSVMSLSLS